MRKLLFHTKDFWETLSFEKDAYDVFKKLYEKYDVYLATSAFLSEAEECIIGKYNFIKKGIVECICADGSKGYIEEAPFDKILVSATADEILPAWKEQLKVGGRIVVPIKSSIWLFIKKSKEEFDEVEYPGFVFVPLVTK